MEIFQGNSGFGGIALGNVKVLKRARLRKSIAENDVERELAVYENAKLLTFHGQQMPDHQLDDAIIGRIINQKMSAAEAVKESCKYFKKVLENMQDEYMRSKSKEMKSLAKKLIESIENPVDFDLFLNEPTIIATKNLSAQELLQMDKENLLGLLIEDSSTNSHMAILAKAMSIPTIIGCEIDESWNGKEVVVDGGWRVVYVEPDEPTKQDMEERIQTEQEKSLLLLDLKGKKCITKDGYTVRLYGNISTAAEVATANQFDAEGIGLYRSEVIYMENTHLPTEEELFREYKKLISGMKEKPVVIRTLDMSADKNPDYFPMLKEGNSALGCRGIRFCLRHLNIFKTQLRAILRAAIYGDVAIMYPMISSVQEIIQAKAVLDEVKWELTNENVLFKEVRQGVMIETPAAVMISDEIAKHVDFISIGTNDLTQYTLGVDRENADLSDICDYHHPAILKMIQIVVENAHHFHIPVGICGELAADTNMTEYFLKIGVDDLSVAPKEILQLRNNIINMDLGGNKS